MTLIFSPAATKALTRLPRQDAAALLASRIVERNARRGAVDR
ncbi:hypothetical protein [Methylobacterium isbiliense]|nr:hypothetical protein [Methylobacterium isbiliense]MDN3622852.1 hypothetical protein [Methylobacterium isbiliense]